MDEFLLACAVIVVATVAAGLARVLRGPGDAERIMAAQLLGTGGIAALLLFGAASGSGSAVDLALTLALLAAFASIAFVKKGSSSEVPVDEPFPTSDGQATDDPRAPPGGQAR